jgi:hypothetical protein
VWDGVTYEFAHCSRTQRPTSYTHPVVPQAVPVVTRLPAMAGRTLRGRAGLPAHARQAAAGLTDDADLGRSRTLLGRLVGRS